MVLTLLVGVRRGRTRPHRLEQRALLLLLLLLLRVAPRIGNSGIGPAQDERVNGQRLAGCSTASAGGGPCAPAPA